MYLSVSDGRKESSLVRVEPVGRWGEREEVGGGVFVLDLAEGEFDDGAVADVDADLGDVAEVEPDSFVGLAVRVLGKAAAVLAALLKVSLEEAVFSLPVHVDHVADVALCITRNGAGLAEVARRLGVDVEDGRHEPVVSFDGELDARADGVPGDGGVAGAEDRRLVEGLLVVGEDVAVEASLVGDSAHDGDRAEVGLLRPLVVEFGGVGGVRGAHDHARHGLDVERSLT
mmetsp:Transcript_25822/g.79448  ORF Transcript_25822/g.79448 Transcript_25822/m.79448 type:complete len:229 (-) Transcript_25822:1151-1837(-)